MTNSKPECDAYPDTAPTRAPVNEQHVRTVLRQIVDPEVGINIVDLGLVYCVAVETACVRVALTMTSPACPLGEMMIEEARDALLAACPEHTEVVVELVWKPAWQPSMMSREARQTLGWQD